MDKKAIIDEKLKELIKSNFYGQLVVEFVNGEPKFIRIHEDIKL